jgi:FG-GAP-like repeat/Bacterial Ig-like domain (group 3)/FG-GAP repeat
MKSSPSVPRFPNTVGLRKFSHFVVFTMLAVISAIFGRAHAQAPVATSIQSSQLAVAPAQAMTFTARVFPALTSLTANYQIGFGSSAGQDRYVRFEVKGVNVGAALATLDAGSSASAFLAFGGVQNGDTTVWIFQVTAQAAGYPPTTNITFTVPQIEVILEPNFPTIRYSLHETAFSAVSNSFPLIQGSAQSLANFASGGFPTGTFAFTQNGSSIAGCTSVPIQSGVATCSTSFPAVGVRTIAATYSGSGSYLTSIATMGIKQVVRVAALDFSGEGRSDILYRSSPIGAGFITAALINNNTFFSNAAVVSSAPGNWTVTHADDFDGDGKADLVWQNTNGAVAVWLMNGTSFTSAVGIMGAGQGWSVTHTGDFNGDGKADLVWRNVDGSVAVWLMDGATLQNAGFLLNGNSGWNVSHVADLDGDGRADIVWRNTNGSVAVWLMNGTSVLSTGFLLGGGSGWSVSHTGDFNGDGKADLVWRNVDGSVAMWLMDGTSTLAGTSSIAFLLGGGQGWNVAHVGDLNGDGRADLIWRNTDGSVVGWLMNGTAPSSTGTIFGANNVWSVKAIRDFNGDGKADLLWQNVDGSAGYWFMNGLSTTSSQFVTGPALMLP